MEISGDKSAMELKDLLRRLDGEQYFSLKEAADFLNFQEEYLSRLVRGGRLKGFKVGDDWFTTGRWMKQLVKGIQEQIVKEIEAAEDLGQIHRQISGQWVRQIENQPGFIYGLPAALVLFMVSVAICILTVAK